MAKTVFITGGSGLLALNWAIKIRNSHKVILGIHNRKIELSGVRVLQSNLESVNHLQREFEILQPDLVIHTAGLTSVEACEAHPEMARYINVNLAVNVAKASTKSGISFVQISTDHLFEGIDADLDENTPVSPLNIYGITKAEAEAAVLEANPNALVIRTNFYGWGPVYRHSFSDVIIEHLKHKKDLTLFTDVFYNPILAETLAETVLDLVALKKAGIYHVIGDDRISKYGFGLKLAEIFQLDHSCLKKGLLSEQHTLVKRPADMSLSNKKATKETGKKIGGVDEQVRRLHEQETSGLAHEIRNI